MTPNNNLNVLPFYDSLEKQNHKKPYAFGAIYTLIAPNAKILPFQIVRAKQDPSSTFGVAEIKNVRTGVVTDILSEMIAAGLRLEIFTDYDLIINNSALIFSSLQLTADPYYLRLTDGENEWFSDIFTVVNDLSQFVKVEYWNSENLYYNGGHIDYAHPYRNYFYAQSGIGKPEYPFAEEAEERDGFTFIEKQVSEKKFKFEFLAPEFLCDALRIVRMHDFINVYTIGRKYSAENIIFVPEWQTQGDLAAVSVEFECDTVIKKTGTSNAVMNADFANDFDDDFSI